jgi:hypothetical protein
MARIIYISPKEFVVYETTGIVPTVPNPATLRKYHKDFLDTDLEVGEWARNIVDGKLWYRNQVEIIEVPDNLFGPIAGGYHNHNDLYYQKTGMPVASPSQLGSIKVGSNLSMSGEVLNASGGGASADWGTIGGDIVDQTDLQDQFDIKAPLTSPVFVTSFGIGASKWTFELSTNDLVLKYNTVIKFKFSSVGDIQSIGEMEPYASI